MVSAYSYGVAGSPVVPITTMGGAPFPSIVGWGGADATGQSGQTRSGPLTRPSTGAASRRFAVALLRLADAVVLAVQATHRRERVVELSVASVDPPPVGEIGQLEQPTRILILIAATSPSVSGPQPSTP